VANRHKVPLIVFAQCKSDATGTPNPSWFGNAKDAINQVARVQAILELDQDTQRQVIHFIKHTNGKECAIELGFVGGAALVRDMPGEPKLERYRMAENEFEPVKDSKGFTQAPEEDDRA